MDRQGRTLKPATGAGPAAAHSIIDLTINHDSSVSSQSQPMGSVAGGAAPMPGSGGAASKRGAGAAGGPSLRKRSRETEVGELQELQKKHCSALSKLEQLQSEKAGADRSKAELAARLDAHARSSAGRAAEQRQLQAQLEAERSRASQQQARLEACADAARSKEREMLQGQLAAAARKAGDLEAAHTQLQQRVQ